MKKSHLTGRQPTTKPTGKKIANTPTHTENKKNASAATRGVLTNDEIEALIQKGKKLRDAMTKALESSQLNTTNYSEIIKREYGANNPTDIQSTVSV